MRKILYLLCAFGTLGWAHAQYNGNEQVLHHGMMEMVEYDLPINGTPFIDEIYKKGTITISNRDGIIEEERLMRFNAFSGNMEYLVPSSEQPRTLLRRENIHVVLDGRTFEVHPYSEGGEIRRAFFIPMNPGDAVTLYKKPVKHFKKGKSPEHGYEVARNPEYFDVSTYYLRFGGESMVPVSLNKRGLLRAMEDQREDLKAFIEQENLKLRDEKDALALIRYYNQLGAIN